MTEPLSPFAVSGFAFAAFVLVLGLIPLVRRLARKAGFVDHPGGRKQHESPVPLIGGLVIFPVYVLLGLCAGAPVAVYGWFYAALLLLLLTGALDDKFTLPARAKFLVQFAAALLIVLPPAARVVSLGDLFGFGPITMGWFGAVFSVIATVLLINAINLLDGLDGLSGGLGFIVLGWFLAGSVSAGHPESTPQLALMMAALAGFLVFNMRNPWRRKASVFMGDAGSLALGVAIAFFAMRLGDGAGGIIHPISVAWVLALPIYDTCGQFARRVREGRHPFDPDANHFHHHFVAAGLSVARSTTLILAICLLTGAVGILGILFVPVPVLTWVWIAGLLAHIYMCMKPERYRALIRKLFA